MTEGFSTSGTGHCHQPADPRPQFSEPNLPKLRWPQESRPRPQLARNLTSTEAIGKWIATVPSAAGTAGGPTPAESPLRARTRRERREDWLPEPGGTEAVPPDDRGRAIPPPIRSGGPGTGASKLHRVPLRAWPGSHRPSHPAGVTRIAAPTVTVTGPGNSSGTARHGRSSSPAPTADRRARRPSPGLRPVVRRVGPTYDPTELPAGSDARAPARAHWRSGGHSCHPVPTAGGAGLFTLLTLAVPSGAGAQAILAEPGAPPPGSLEGRPVVLVTGSTSGLGREVALAMAGRGAHVIVHGRNRERGIEVVERIAAEGAGSASFHAADFGSMARVQALGETILRDYGRLDVLVNNAGIWLSGDDTRRVSTDGHELSFAVNYLSHFLLTRMLLPMIPASPASRIVNVSSGAQTPIDFEDPMIEDGYSSRRSYAQSKLAQILFTFDLAEELEDTGIRVNALHPATLMDTNMVLSAGVRPRSSVAEGLEAVMQLIVSENVGSGQYFDGRRPSRAHAQAYDEEARARLRRLSEEIVGR